MFGAGWNNNVSNCLRANWWAWTLSNSLINLGRRNNWLNSCSRNRRTNWLRGLIRLSCLCWSSSNSLSSLTGNSLSGLSGYSLGILIWSSIASSLGSGWCYRCYSWFIFFWDNYSCGCDSCGGGCSRDALISWKNKSKFSWASFASNCSWLIIEWKSSSWAWINAACAIKYGTLAAISANLFWQDSNWDINQREGVDNSGRSDGEDIVVIDWWCKSEGIISNQGDKIKTI